MLCVYLVKFEIEECNFREENMKFMKLESRPDAFQSAGSCTRFVSSELLTDVVITIGDVKFHLHKEHPSLSKAEKKNLCGLMDAKKLTPNAAMHAAQNNQLPLRVIIQILFFEQARAAAGVNTQSPRKTKGKWTKTTIGSCRSLRKQTDDWTVKEEENTKNGNLKRKGSKNIRGSAGQLLPSRSRRIFDKLWTMCKGSKSETIRVRRRQRVHRAQSQ